MRTIRWYSEARLLVHDQWAAAANRRERDRINDACEELVSHLCDYPLEFSKSRENGFRITILSPLAVPFYIETEAQIVFITLAWLPDELGGKTQ